MKLTILGSGTLYPKKDRKPAAFLLKTESAKFLLDCGFGTIARLVEMQIDPREISGIFISHFHTDHFADAFSLIHSRFVADLYEEKKEHRKIPFWGPRGTEERYKNWRKIFWPEPAEAYLLEFNENTGEFGFEDMIIRTFVVRHVPYFESVGIRIESAGKVLIYPGDIGSNTDLREMVEISRNADLLLIEPGSEKPTPNHFTIEQTQKLSGAANVKKTVFIHIRPNDEDRVRKFVEGSDKFEMGKDGMEIVI